MCFKLFLYSLALLVIVLLIRMLFSVCFQVGKNTSKLTFQFLVAVIVLIKRQIKLQQFQL